MYIVFLATAKLQIKIQLSKYSNNKKDNSDNSDNIFTRLNALSEKLSGSSELSSNK